MFYTYVLRCTDSQSHRDSIYIGSTTDLKMRLSQHQNKEVKTTKSYDSIRLIYYEACMKHVGIKLMHESASYN